MKPIAMPLTMYYFLKEKISDPIFIFDRHIIIFVESYTTEMDG
jgi:hypothetical protein